MASLRPLRSISPSPSSQPPQPQLQPSGIARQPQSRQSLGPPTVVPSSATRSSFGQAAAGYRHASLAGSPQTGGTRLGANGNGNGTMRPTMGGARPSSEYIKRDTPEPEPMDGWFNDLTQYESTLEAMATASLDQNFTDELGAIEQWFRVLNEHERTAALYSLLQHATPIQIRFFTTVLTQMAKSDPMTALLSPAGGTSLQAQMESRLASGGSFGGLKSPLIGGFPGSASSPNPNQFLAPESALDATLSPTPGSNTAALSAQRPKRQNRISAPGTLQLAGQDKFAGGNLDNVMERGPSPGVDSVISHNSPYLSAIQSDPTARPKSTDFAGLANVPNDVKSPFARSPRPGTAASGGNPSSNTLGLGHPSPNNNATTTTARFGDDLSPLIGNWASMANTPMMPMFTDQNLAQAQAEAMANALKVANWNAANGKVVLDDASKFRRTTNRQQSDNSAVGAMYNDEGELVATNTSQPGRTGSPMLNQTWTRSPLVGGGDYGGNAFSGLGGVGQFGLGYDNNATTGLNGLGMGLSMNNGSTMGNLIQANQMFAISQAQQNTAAAFAASSGMGQFGNGGGGAAPSSYRQGDRVSSRTGGGKRSPMTRQSPSPGAQPAPTAGSGGGAGAGAGVAGPDDVDERVLRDVSHWLRVLRLHKYTPNFETSRWQEIVLLSDNDLSEKGVAALGARRKLLKAFANIRNHYGIAHPEGYVPDVDPVNADAEGKEGGSQSGQV